MRAMKTHSLLGQLLRAAPVALVALLAGTANAATPGLDGTSTPAFALTATDSHISQPDGASLYAWGYGCTNPSGQTFLPAGLGGAGCPTMQLPAPTLIVRQGATVVVTLTNNLPAAAGNTSILFPGFNVTAAPAATQPSTCTAATPAPAGTLTIEAAHGCAVTYTFTATAEGTHSYYSGTQGDLQVEMGLYGAIVVLPATAPASCTPVGAVPAHYVAPGNTPEADFRLASSAYSHSATCYDREYLFQFSEMDQRIHAQAEAQVLADNNSCAKSGGCLAISTEPYHPTYFMINGRSMPDDMDPNYAAHYPHQPYNGNPHMHPGELTLLRIIGQGRWQHPFHEHGNHVRMLARDGNLILAPNLVGTETEYRLAGPLLFTTTTTPGQAMDGIFQWSGKGLNWDVYAHGQAGDGSSCLPDGNGFHRVTTDPNYYEWCADHAKPLEKNPFGAVGGGGPMTLPDPNIVINGPWYSGTAYLGPEAAARAVGPSPIPPSGTIANNSGSEAGFAYMWHSHNEREITTDNVFPGGMLMMMLVDPRAYQIDESL
jgi:FtsP/CotA-like multicopper oxidase with cupredoxin domain